MAPPMWHMLTAALSFFSLVKAVADTDEYRDADLRQSSYLDNHNIDPAVVDSNQFGLLWKIPFNSKEKFYAKPLTFTPRGGSQLVFIASSQNYIRTIDAKNGTVLNTRQVATPFIATELGCSDIPDTIGIIGTPVIDPATEIAYFYAKSYIPNFRTSGNTGVINGVYYFYAVKISDLSNVPGYPILVDGSPADNDPRKRFIGGVILQRPSLLQMGKYVYAAFGGHCDKFNYTGTILGVDITQGKLTTNWAVESGPNSRFDNDYNGNGGEGGIWMAGMSLSTDGNRIFVATGNGATGENQDVSASGQSGCRTLGEAVINLAIDDATGKLSVVDYFQPYDYKNMDGGDQDFGAGGVVLLDPKTFNGTGVARIAITSGKNGKIYFMNADNLGGYQQGPGKTDLILQTITTNQAVFGGVGSYPLEGGYIYSTPNSQATSVYKFGRNQDGQPVFVLAGKTAENSAGRVGVGVPVITTYKGRPGTAIMWETDPDAGIRAWYAVPKPDQSMTRIKLPQVDGVNKFQRPAFGDGRVYTTDSKGALYCLGAPVNLPLNCSSPLDFGNVPLGSSKTQSIVCTALIAVSSINNVVVSDSNFKVNTSTVPRGAITKGSTFSFQVTWDLTNVTVKPAQNASFGNTSPGIKSAALTISTTNGVGGYTNSFPLSLTGNEVSKAAYLSLAPQTVDFGGLVLGAEGENPTSTLAFTISNLGQTAMKILGYAYVEERDDDDDDSDLDFTNVTYSTKDSVWDFGTGFTAPYLPPVNGLLNPGETASIQATLEPVNGKGSYLSYFNVWSSGGHAQIILEGYAATKPIANFSISDGAGGWLPGNQLTLNFGVAYFGQAITRQIRICNQGGSVLTITKSKPPLGEIRAQNYGVDLHESEAVPVNSCAYAAIVFAPNQSPPNIPDRTVTNTWTLNVDDVSFGVHMVQFVGTVRDTMVGPAYPNGTSIYQYLGCYKDNNPGKIAPKLVYSDGTTNTNAKCQAACQAAGYIFAGTEYRQECWCGNAVPDGRFYYPESEGHCTFACPGDKSQPCGGNGAYISVFYDTTKYRINGSTYNNGNGSSTSTTSTTSTSSTSTTSRGTSTTLSSTTITTSKTSTSITSTSTTSSSTSSRSTISTTSTTTSSTSSTRTTSTSSTTSSSSSSVSTTSTRSTTSSTSSSVTSVSSTSSSTTSTTTTSATTTTAPLSYYYVSYGCWSDKINADSHALSTLYTNDSMSLEVCAYKAAKLFAKYFGVENGRECWYGATFSNASQRLSATSCNISCPGDRSELCGGSSALQMFTLTSNSPTLSTTTSRSSTGTSSNVVTMTTTTSTSTRSTSTAVPTPFAPPMIYNYTYVGCYNDTDGGLRALNGIRLTGSVSTYNMTLEKCATFCSKYAYFGVEYTQECYCGTGLFNNTRSQLASSCNKVCLGNTTELCGGSSRLQLYYYNATRKAADMGVQPQKKIAILA